MSNSPAQPTPTNSLEIVRRFALALDTEDYATAAALLAPDCRYTIRGSILQGPAAIIRSYKGNGDQAAQVFDEITYGSEVVPAAVDHVATIRFYDRITHRGESLEHACEQRVRVADPTGIHPARIIEIEHHDLPVERERLAAFKTRHGL